MYRYKVSNLYKIVIDFNLLSIRWILTNSSFTSIDFVNNKKDQENFTLEFIYKSNNYTSENKINIKSTPVKKTSRR